MEREKKYGLFVNPSKNSQANNRKTFVQNLGESSDSDEDLPTRDGMRLNSSVKIQQQIYANKISDEMSKNLLEDANVYEYDSLFEDISATKRSNNRQEVKDDKPKYMNSILATRERINLERSINIEKIEKKRRERESKESGVEDQKFVTRAYEKKLIMDKKREVEIDKIEKADEKNTINSEFGMMGFYANLLSKNSAFAGGVRAEEKIREVGEDKEDKVLKEKRESDNVYMKVFNEKKKQFEKVVKDEEEEEEIQKIIEKSQKDEKKSESTPPGTSEIPGKVTATVDDYKNRYLERKRNRAPNS